MEKYRIGEASDILGISIDTLRFYESQGIVSPQKDIESNYRYYDAWDLNFLLDCKWLRSFDFPLAKAEKIINEYNTDEIQDQYSRHEKELHETINAYRLKLKSLIRHRARLGAIKENHGKLREENSPELVFQQHRNINEFYRSGKHPASLEKWVNLMPMVNHTFRIPEKCLVERDIKGEYQWGFSLSPEDARRFGFKVQPPLEYIPAKKSQYTVFTAQEKNTFRPSVIRQVVEPIEKGGYTIRGDAFGNLIVRAHENGKIVRFFEIWVPVE
jgi:DNA-binding transcriptional MerR regulator